MRRTLLGAVLMVAVVCPGAYALDPSLDLTQYTHTAWTARDGLRGSIRSIVQTPDGYLWLGTEFGVVRFDGVRFVPWVPPAGQHLPSDDVLTLLATRDGTLWIGTIDGLASWRDDKLVQYTEFAGEPVISFLEDREGTVWVGGSGKLCGIRSGKVECYTTGDPVKDVYRSYGNRGQGVMSLYEDSDGRLWAGTESGLWQWQPGSPQRYLSQPIFLQQAIARGDHAGELIVISGDKHLLRQVINNKPEDYVLPGVRPFKPSRLLRDRNGALWIGTLDQGLLRAYQGKTRRFSLNNGLSGNLVTALFEDREGSVWVGTVNGLDRFREPVVTTISGHQGLSPPAWAVLPARAGSVWISSLDGLDQWNQGRVTIYRSVPRPQMVEHRDLNGSAREIRDPGLPDNQIGSLFEDQRGRIWVTTSRGAAWFENGRFNRVRGVPVGSAYAITADNSEGVWISYPQHGLVHVVEGRAIESVPWPWSKQGYEPRLSSIVSDPVNGGLWLGFLDRGIAHVKDGRVDISLSGNRIWSLRMDHDGALWAATQGGLSRIKDGHVATLTTSNGLPCDAIHWSMEDDASSLWLYTACGLLRLDWTELEEWVSDSRRVVHPTLFDGSDGVRMHAMIIGFSPVVARSKDGKLWFAHLDGVSFIDPHNLRVNKVPPPVHVEQITVDGKTYAAASGLRLAPRIRNLTIDYTALSLVAPEKVRFRFKLEGQDKDWREVVNVRRVQYSNLPPGNYRFRVMASNNSGVWNEEGASLEFVIPPAWYQANWFRAVCVAVLLALIWLVYRLRVREIEEREKKFREAVESMPALAFVASSENERTFVNKGWVEYTGLTVEQASGSGWHAAVHPDDLEGVLDKWRTAVTTGKPLDYEVRLRHAVDGEYRWFHTRVVPLQDKRGKIVKWCGVATDISERKRAEQALALRSFALDNARDAVFLIGEQGRFLYVNEESCRSLGYTREELLGMGVPDIDPDFPMERWLDTWHTLKEQPSLNFESYHCTKDGRVFPVEITAKYLEYGGQPLNLAVARDITQRKRAEEERETLRADLAHLNRVSMLGELAASIAHEINQPLSGIVSNASACLRFLAGDSPDLEEIREATHDIVRDGKRAGEVIARIRAMTRRAAAPREKLDLNEIIREVLGLVGDEARRKSVIVRTQFADDLSTVAGDRVQLQQVVLNLVMNAIEAMSSIGERPRELVITTRSVDTDHVEATVEDSGIGLDPKTIDKIFESFYTTKPGGMGMGLSICRSILQAHGGRLWAVGKDAAGTAFHFTVPKYHDEGSNGRVAAV